MKSTFNLGLAVFIGILQITSATDTQNLDVAADDHVDAPNPDCDLFDSEMSAFDSLEEDEENDISTETIEMPEYDNYDFPTDNAYLPIYNTDILPSASSAVDSYTTPTESASFAEQTETLEPYLDSLSEGMNFGHSKIILTLSAIMFFL
jgi:hypothetical protein